MYGRGSDRFKKTVTGWLETVNENKSGLYCLNKNLYDDSGRTTIKHNIDDAKYQKLMNQKLESGKIDAATITAFNLIDEWGNKPDKFKKTFLSKLNSLPSISDIFTDLEDLENDGWDFQNSLQDFTRNLIESSLELEEFGVF